MIKIICAVFIIGISMAYVISYGHFYRVEESRSLTHQTELNEMQEKYELKLKDYQNTIQNLQMNNIVSSKTVYLPSGEKIVTRVVDKTMRQSKIENRATQVVEDRDVDSERIITKVGDFEKRSTGSSIHHYKLGLVDMQPLKIDSVNSLTEGQVLVGVRLFDLPIWLDVSSPIKNFDIRIGFEIEL